MKKYTCLFVLLLATSVFAQSNVIKTLTFTYAGGNSWRAAAGDTIADAEIDTLEIGILGPDSRSPVSVQLFYEFYGIGGTADSVNVTYQMGDRNTWVTVGSAVYEAISGITTGGITRTRTLVLNNTGAAAANNTQASLVPVGRAIRLIVAQASNDSETVKYLVKASAVYKD